MRLITMAVLAGVLVLAGCDRQEADWAEAVEQDTVAAYQAYLERHPETEYSAEARERIAELRAEQAWERARETNSPTAYEDFLQEHRDSGYAAEAEERLEQLNLQAEWQQLRMTSDRGALEAFVDRYRDSEEAAQARQRIAELREAEERAEQERLEAERAARGTHRVQLAALRTAERAQAGAEQLQRDLAEVLGEVGIDVQGGNGLHLLQTTPMAREEADTLCQQLRQRDQDCLVVEAR